MIETQRRWSDVMASRVTIHFDEDLHRALQLKAAEADVSISTLVNDAVRQSLLEDSEDLSALWERREEPGLSFDCMVDRLRRHGRN
jgi:hypothetical protein